MPEDVGIVGRLIANRYLIEEPCERTDASAIYRARHLPHGQTVLFRIFGERPGISHDRCRAALGLAERAGALASPHVARTIDVGVVAERWPFAVSEYTRGQTLAAIVERQGPLAVSRLLPLARALASVLDLAHGAGLVHGELLPCGIWVESPGGRADWIRLLDYGIRELFETPNATSQSGVYRSSSLCAEPATFSPDAARSDVQALGALLQALLGSLLGSDAWGERNALTLGLAAIVERCLSLAPDVAYPSMREVSHDLDGLAETGGVQAWRGGRPPVTAIHAPARRAHVAFGGPKVIVRGS